MNKIKTIFDRDWDGNRGVIDVQVNSIVIALQKGIATEKLDGTNVRLTVRNNTLIRLEKRRNPSKKQKLEGISDPWYVDADPYDPQDKYIYEAANNADLTNIPDGEWSAEAMGPKIQGNPLNLKEHTVCIFSYGQVHIIRDVPLTYDGLKKWLPKQKSQFGDGLIEGIVWHCENGDMYKIKTKDFK